MFQRLLRDQQQDQLQGKITRDTKFKVDLKKKNEDSNMNNLSRNWLRNKEDRIRVSLRFTLSLNLPNYSYS